MADPAAAQAAAKPQPPSPMRITIYTDDPGEGGVAVYNHRMSLGLLRLGHDVTLVQSKPTLLAVDDLLASGVKLLEIPFDTRADLERNLADTQVAAELLTEAKPDVVLFSNCSQFSHIAAANAAIELKVPYVFVQGYVTPYKTLDADVAWRIERLEKQFAAAAAVIAVSADNLQILRSHYKLNTQQGEVIHYGRPEEYFVLPDPNVRLACRQELGISTDDVMCLTTARYATVKGYQHQVTAIKALAKVGRLGNLKFVWAGAGPEHAAIQHRLAVEGLEGIVQLAGFRRDVPRLLDAADLFVLPSYYEGMPLSIMEAMAKGLPIVASAVSGIPEMLGQDGRAGVLLPDPKVDSVQTQVALAKALAALASDPHQRTMLGAAARVRATQLFRESRMIAQTASVLERTMINTRSRPIRD